MLPSSTGRTPLSHPPHHSFNHSKPLSISEARLRAHMLAIENSFHHHVSDLAVTANRQFHQVIHKGLKGDIIGEDGLGGLADTTVCTGRVCR